MAEQKMESFVGGGGGGGRTCRGSARAGQWVAPVTSIACGPAKIRGLGVLLH